MRRHDDRVDVRGGCCLQDVGSPPTWTRRRSPGSRPRHRPRGGVRRLGPGRRWPSGRLAWLCRRPHQHKRRSRHDDFAGNVQSTLSQDRAVERDQEPIRATAHGDARPSWRGPGRPGSTAAPLQSDAAEHNPLEAAAAVARDHDRRRGKLVREVEQGEGRAAVTHDRLDLQAGPASCF